MNTSVKTKSTVEVIRDAAQALKDAAITLDRHADEMENNGNLNIAAEVVTTIINLLPNLRLDLLVTRPLREMGRSKPSDK